MKMLYYLKKKLKGDVIMKIISKKRIYTVVLFLILNSLSLITSQTSDRVNDIHLFPLENLQVDNSNGTIKLYFKLEKAKLVNPSWSLKGTVVKRESPTTGKSGYFLIEPYIKLTTKNFSVQEAPRGEDIFTQITELESNLEIISAPKESKIFSILLIDVSGSITKTVKGEPKPVLDDLKNAANVFIDSMKIDNNRELAVYAFDGREELIPIIDFSNNPDAIKSKVSSIDSSITKDFSTNLYGSIVKSIEKLDTKLEENINQGAITSGILTIFTDGTDQAKRLGKNGDDIVMQSMKDLKTQKRNVYFYTIGLGREYDEKILKTFGMDSYKRAISAGALAPTFKELAEEIDNLSNCYYRLTYQTPSRKGAGKMRLIIDVKDGVYWGGYRFTFDTSEFNF